mmetsp:Transcript_32760/g.37433  ORF Transcript_32760/g.37433 Transcript_32760/m.37433 type:complete len:157 (-) Transcript_32760:30-500(-)
MIRNGYVDQNNMPISSNGYAANPSLNTISQNLSNDFLYVRLLKTLEQNYCIGSLNTLLNCLNACIPTNSTSHNMNSRRNEPQVKLSPDQPGASFNSSSSNRNSCEQGAQPEASSQPVSHNEHNKDWFNISGPPYYQFVNEVFRMPNQFPQHYCSNR